MKFAWPLFFACALAQAAEFKLLSWNVYLLPFPIKSSHQSERLEQIVRKLQDTKYDLLVFQEAFTDDFSRKLQEGLIKNYPQNYRPKKGPGWWKIFDSGLLVLSPHPFKFLGEDFFTECTTSDCFATKGVALVEVSVSGMPAMQFAVTHMQAGHEAGSVEIRRSQLTQVRGLLDKYRRPGVPQFLVGDLNIDAFHPEEYPRGQRYLGMTPLPLTGELTSSQSPLTRPFGLENAVPKKRLDHIWMRHSGPEFALEMAQTVLRIQGRIEGKECDLSDHLPVEAKLKIP